MSNRVENSKQLKAEINRLQLLSIEQEKVIVEDFEAIQQQFSPSNLISASINSLLEGNDKEEGFLSKALIFIINLISRKTIFKNSTGIVGTMLSSGFELVISKIISSKSDKIKEFFMNFFSKKEKPQGEEVNEKNDFSE